MSGTWYNASAAFGIAATYVYAIIAVILALLCVSFGATLVRSPEPKGQAVQATVLHASAGCQDASRPCTVTVAYSFEGKDYSASFASFLDYKVGDPIMIRVSQDNPQHPEQDLPRKTFGWSCLASAVVTVCLAINLVNFVSDSKNFAAATGAFTFLRALLAL